MSFPRRNEAKTELVRRAPGDRDLSVEGVDKGILIHVKDWGIVAG